MENVLKVIFCLFLLTSNCQKNNREFKEGSVITRDGIQLYYCIIGTGADTVIVPAAVLLKNDFKRLSPGRTLIFYDSRNRGLSQAVADSVQLGIEFELSDLRSICQHFKIKNTSLIGWSYLGAVVALYATNYPEQINRIIQIAPIPPRKNPYWQQYETIYKERLDSAGFAGSQRMRNIIKENTTSLTYDRICSRISAHAMFAKPENFDLFNRDFMELENESWENSNFTLSQIHASLEDWDWREKMSNLLMPVLVIQGEQDPLPMASASEWARILPDAHLVKIPSAGHLPFVERPDIFYPAVEQFLNGEWPDGS